MHTSASAFDTLALRHRIAGTVAALALTAAVLGVLMALFASASSSPWLPDTPAAIAQAAVCDQARSRGARDTCMRDTVAHWQAAEPRGVRLASSH